MLNLRQAEETCPTAFQCLTVCDVIRVQLQARERDVLHCLLVQWPRRYWVQLCPQDWNLHYGIL